MVSWEKDFELAKFSCYVAGLYRPKMTMHMGSKHDCLNIDMEFKQDGMLYASMVTYLKSVMADLPEIVGGRVAMPASNHLFQREDK
jgi:hypothetical protein